MNTAEPVFLADFDKNSFYPESRVSAQLNVACSACLNKNEQSTPVC